MFFRITTLSITAFSFACLQAETLQTPPSPFVPIYGGTIYEPSPLNQEPGEALIQPFYQFVWSYGEYDNRWSRGSGVEYLQGQTSILSNIGITKYIELEIQLRTQSTFYESKTSSHFGDTTVGLGFQFLWQSENINHPNIRVELQETFPTGRYDHLNAHFKGNDASGTGSYTSTLLFELTKVLYGIKDHPVFINTSIGLDYSTPVEIQGTSAYGPISRTRGKIGHRYQINFGITAEYSITRHWVFGIDLEYEYRCPTSFTSHLDDLNETLDPLISSQATNLIFIAPCLEYNFSERCGLIIGGAFTVIGQNIDAQAMGNISFYLLY